MPAVLEPISANNNPYVTLQGGTGASNKGARLKKNPSDQAQQPEPPELRSVGNVAPKIAVVPNHAMLAAMAKIENRQRGMREIDGKDTQEYIREARSGATFDHSATKE